MDEVQYTPFSIAKEFGVARHGRDAVIVLEGEIRRLRAVVAAADRLLSIYEDKKIEEGTHNGA